MFDFGEKVVALRKAHGLQQKELARRAGMSASQLCQIENNRVSPTINMVERLVVALGMDLAGFFGKGRSKSSVSPGGETVREIEVETGDYVPVRATEPDATKVLELILPQEEARDRAEASRGLVPSCSIAMNRARPHGLQAGALFADELRNDLGLGTAPIADLSTVLEFRGVRVYHEKMVKQTASVSFFNARTGVPVIVLNAANTKERDLYRLAYELGSVCLYVALGRVRLDESLEQHRFLTDFTAAFLMPGVTIREYVAATGIRPEEWTFASVVALKEKLGVSAEAFALRLEELGLIVPSLRVSIREELHRYYRKHPKAMEPRAKDGSYLSLVAGRGKKR